MQGFKVKKLDFNAKFPTRATAGSAGYDLYTYTSGKIEPRNYAIVDTKISIKLPINTCGLIWPRSGLSAKYGIETGAGVIDNDYTGEVKVILHNHSDKLFTYEQGMRIAQLLITPIVTPNIEIFSDTDDSKEEKEEENTRQDGGFGSTGLY